MEEAGKDWMMIRVVSGSVFLLVLAHPGSPGQRAVKRLLLLFYCAGAADETQTTVLYDNG